MLAFASISVEPAEDGFAVTLNGQYLLDAAGEKRVFPTAQEAGEAAEKIAKADQA